MSRTHGLQPLKAAGVLIAALATFGAASAGAAGDSGSSARTAAQVETQLTTAGSAVARCPVGKVVSGGFSAPGFSKKESPVVRVGSAAVGRREWRVDAVMFGDDPNGQGDLGGADPSPPSPGTIVSHAYCAETPGRIKTHQSSVQVPLNGFGTVTARCGRGQRAIAGGFASPGLDIAARQGVVALSSRKAGKRGWTVEGLNTGDGVDQPAAAGTLTAIAYCLKDGPRLIERSLQASVGKDQLRTFDVSCPAGTKAVSGGFDGNVGPLGEQLTAAGAVESFRMRRAAGWTTSAISVDDTVGATITGYVYCGPKTT
jgi:hypothetical protein